MTEYTETIPFIAKEPRLLWSEGHIGSSYVCFEGGKGTYGTPPKHDIVSIEEDDLWFFTLAIRKEFPEWSMHDVYTHVHHKTWQRIFYTWESLCTATSPDDIIRIACEADVNTHYFPNNANQLYLIAHNKDLLWQRKRQEQSLYDAFKCWAEQQFSKRRLYITVFGF